jgi:tRNA nucleotidyltransferase (CCA-adding enzyme)
VPQRADYHPEIDTGVHLLMVLDMAARLNASLEVRFACLGHDLGKGTTPPDILPRHLGHEQRSVDLVRAVCERLRVPVACRELAEVVAREHGNVHRSGEFGAAALVRLFDRCDAWRRPGRFAEMLLACECDARGRLGLSEAPYPQRERLLRALGFAQAIDTAAAARVAAARGLGGADIGAAIQAARAQAVGAGLGEPGSA